jgi:hypothetical protein
MEYIYFIGEEPFDNRVKIGKTADIPARIKQLQTGSARKLVCLESIFTLKTYTRRMV